MLQGVCRSGEPSARRNHASTELSVIDALPNTRCPTLLVNGVHERNFQGLRQQLPEVLNGCRIVDLPAGHAVNIEAAEGFNEAVLTFFKSVLA
jgi:pimeloyl-ACP methyl ester carboxylesterase